MRTHTSRAPALHTLHMSTLIPLHPPVEHSLASYILGTKMALFRQLIFLTLQLFCPGHNDMSPALLS